MRLSPNYHGLLALTSSLTGRTHRIASLLQGGTNNAVVSADRSTIEERTDVDSNMYRQWNPSRTRRFRGRAAKARFFRRMDTEPAGQHPQPRRCRRAERCRANRAPGSNLPVQGIVCYRERPSAVRVRAAV